MSTIVLARLVQRERLLLTESAIAVKQVPTSPTARVPTAPVMAEAPWTTIVTRNLASARARKDILETNASSALTVSTEMVPVRVSRVNATCPAPAPVCATRRQDSVPAREISAPTIYPGLALAARRVLTSTLLEEFVMTVTATLEDLCPARATPKDAARVVTTWWARSVTRALPITMASTAERDASHATVTFTGSLTSQL